MTQMKKILYISPTSNPFSVQYGGAQRSNLLLRACMKIAEVDVISFEYINVEIIPQGVHILYNETIPNEYVRDTRLRKFCKFFTAWRMESQWDTNPKRAKIIDKFVCQKHYDYIVTRYVHEAVGMGLMKYASRLVVDIDDNPVEKAANGAKLAKTLRNKIYMSLYAKMTDIALRSFLQKIAVSFFSNKKEAQAYNSMFLPNIPFYTPDYSKLDRKYIKQGRILFVGDLTYAPNYTGLEHFLSKIYPRLNRNIEMHIVGRIPDEERRQRWSAMSGVSVLGFVDDLVQEYAEAEIMVIPIYFGAGTCIKVLEAMQMQRVLITTSVGIRGYEDYISPNKDFLLANTDDEFVTFIQEAMDNPILQTKLTDSAKKKILHYFTKDTFFETIKKALK